jgi:hypothetical protein
VRRGHCACQCVCRCAARLFVRCRRVKGGRGVPRRQPSPPSRVPRGVWTKLADFTSLFPSDYFLCFVGSWPGGGPPADHGTYAPRRCIAASGARRHRAPPPPMDQQQQEPSGHAQGRCRDRGTRPQSPWRAFVVSAHTQSRPHCASHHPRTMRAALPSRRRGVGACRTLSARQCPTAGCVAPGRVRVPRGRPKSQHPSTL